MTAGQKRRFEAAAAPSVNARSLAHTTSSATSRNPAAVSKPQSVLYVREEAFASLFAIVADVHTHSSLVFYDLGCGRPDRLIQTSLIYFLASRLSNLQGDQFFGAWQTSGVSREKTLFAREY
ncbi:MAG: hypothetical protein QF921_02935 [Pseudomonadales bacterium]|jgi:hypothetical protein|nr:hypothetical protein [Pseudomonadales bacterium]MDP6825621.1 hypothetical protein [Pseudomonadales bacterium]MDP6970464.1 hypothetical protein [Pseudomonadales bacterium]|tara:strand:+ start:2948 stop:3313 length:366 start_codon:yes stop_codon:yes gene_type:complete